MSASSPADALAAYRGQIVVLDLASPYVVIGTLIDEDHRYVVLDDADVHDLRDSSTTRELYVLDVRRHGLGPNRRRVLINRSDVVGISLLDNVVQ
jgi:hypothetical protein